MRDVLDAIGCSRRRRRAGGVRDRDLDDPVGAAPARREDGDQRERPDRGLGLRRLCRSRRRGPRGRDLRGRRGDGSSTTASPTATPGRWVSCGGEIDVWLELADGELWDEVRALLAADGYGMLYTDTKTGAKHLERGVLEATGLRDDGVFVEVVEGPLRLVVFGAAEAAEHLCADGSQLGWRTTVVDPRGALATRERLPSAGEIVNAWPDEASDRIDERTAVVTLSHEERLDIPAIAVGLERHARYIGAIGARRTEERRRAALVERGFSEADPPPYPRAGRLRPRRPRAGAGRACDRGRDRRRHLRRREARPHLRRSRVAPVPTRQDRPRWWKIVQMQAVSLLPPIPKGGA